ncbi:anaerobic ribonucleoside-triphosphate reductase activating protein [Sporohalobacter salinus]|uniref:anaerobic ribonucleoside-triphosphate reductase activating protein n=1 Tax=Sporohalobacter salinus TaxID=1494606 RepID=UPI00195F9361|nr:anaerobic ribonucleoside-triphosphate reductase activating protein [Sporohalobacter salinus]MBM7624399.1 pyruvate formate lyase activating enzyme [Sporohalobacter salinus]
MRISGIRKTSLIDYAGQIVTTVFTQGCNLRCAYCHNAELIDFWTDDKPVFNSDDILDFISRRKELIDGVCITGGEPTLQRGLIDFIREIKELGLKVKLDTNGSRPEIIAELIRADLIDYIAMDIKAAFDNLDLTGLRNEAKKLYRENVEQSIDLIMESEVGYEFRTTVVPGIHSELDIEAIAERIAEADKYYIQNFTPNNPVDSKLEEITGFSETKLDEFKKIADSYVEQVKIRN